MTEISIDDFLKLDLRVAKVVGAEEIEEADIERQIARWAFFLSTLSLIDTNVTLICSTY